MGHRISWFDIPVNDLERASNFYRQVLGVNIEIYGGEAPVAVMEHGPGDVAGCLFRNEGDEPSMRGPLLYFTVEGRLTEATGLVEEHGGKIHLKSAAGRGTRVRIELPRRQAVHETGHDQPSQRRMAGGELR